MRAIGLSGSCIGHRNCECGVGAEGTGERGQGVTGEAEHSAGLATAEEPLLPVLEKQAAAAAAAARGRRGKDEQCLRVKL